VGHRFIVTHHFEEGGQQHTYPPDQGLVFSGRGFNLTGLTDLSGLRWQ